MDDTKFKTLLKKVQTLTFVELLASLSFAVLLTSIVILFEVKTLFFQRHIVPDIQTLVSPNVPRMVLSNIDVSAIERFVKDHADVSAVGAISVDLSENTRTQMVMVFNDKQIEEIVAAKKKPLTSPLFTANVEANAEISALLNGQFTCGISSLGPYEDDREFMDLINTTCRVPVPPYYGRLTGYLVFHFRRELSIYDIDRLRRAALRLSIDMYYSNSLVTQAAPRGF